MVYGLPPEKAREVDNILFRDRTLQSTLVPGVPIPAWMDMDDIPADSVVRVDSEGNELRDERVLEFLGSHPNVDPEFMRRARAEAVATR